MHQHTTVVGFDVHRDRITVAVLPPEATRPRETVTIENHPKALQRLVTRWADSVPRYLSTKRGLVATVHGFMLEKGQFTKIDFPGAIETGAEDINDREQIVGGYADSENFATNVG